MLLIMNFFSLIDYQIKVIFILWYFSSIGYLARLNLQVIKVNYFDKFISIKI